MESSREDQIMEVFNLLLERYCKLFKKTILISGEDIDQNIHELENLHDEIKAHMTGLVYGKGADTE